MIAEHGGLPNFDQITKGHGLVEGLSGKSVFRYQITDRAISVVDTAQGDLMFQAMVSNFISNTIRYNIRTKGYLGNPDQKHPDLFGMKLAVAAYQFFWSQGIQIDDFLAVWAYGESPENLDAYSRKFERLQPYYRHGFVTAEEREQIAIRNTFSYRLAVNLGFPQISGVSYRYQGLREVMSIWFSRPDNVKIVNPFAKNQDFLSSARSPSYYWGID
ncbi:MAG: hypothetical protein WC775_03405 [Patescibacteria group bacterium]|jgi:hypothetical protein